MEFYVYETGEIIKSNNETNYYNFKQRKRITRSIFRDVFSITVGSDVKTLKQIVNVYFPNIKKSLLDSALKLFLVREMPGLKKNHQLQKLLIG